MWAPFAVYNRAISYRLKLLPVRIQPENFRAINCQVYAKKSISSSSYTTSFKIQFRFVKKLYPRVLSAAAAVALKQRNSFSSLCYCARYQCSYFTSSSIRLQWKLFALMMFCLYKFCTVVGCICKSCNSGCFYQLWMLNGVINRLCLSFLLVQFKYIFIDNVSCWVF